MGRHNKKRKYQDFSSDSKIPQQNRGIGNAMPELKKQKRSPEPMESTGNSSMTTTEAIQKDFDKAQAQRDVDNDGWQTVTHRSHLQSAKRDIDGKKTKYPELVFHFKKQESIRLADLQQLILYTFADGIAPTWVALKHFGHTRKIVTLMVPGLEKGMFDGSSDLFKKERSESEDQATSAENINISALGSKSDLATDVEQSKRDEFHAWKHGQQRPEHNSDHVTPVNITASTLPSCLKPIAEVFSQVWPVKAPGDSRYAKIHSPLQAMLIAPLPRNKNNTSDHSQGSRSTDKIRTPISHFVHAADELREAEYPIHSAAFSSMEDGELEKQRRIAANQSTEAGWIDSAVAEMTPVNRPDRGRSSLGEGFDVYSVDCEMVLTSDDVYSLARISIVDWSGKTVLDRYVKPNLPIKNYFTQFSGITSALLEDVTTTLSDIQAELIRLCTPSTILLGHSLESDLAALKFTHPFIIDTSLIYPHPRGPPLRSSLKYLTQKYLQREIQSGGSSGHNSVEDALAVLDLVKLKCEKGSKFGTFEASGESIFRTLGRSRGGKAGKTSAIVDFGTPERGFGKDATHAVGCADDEEVTAGTIRAVKGDPTGEQIKAGGVDFIWGRLRELESFRGWCNNNREYGTTDALHANANGNGSVNSATTAAKLEETADPDTVSTDAHQVPTTTSNLQVPQTPTSDLTLETTITRTASHIKTIYDSLPPCTLFIVYSGTGDPREVGRLQKMQSQYRKEFKVKKWDDLSVKWTDTEEQALKAAVQSARRGVGFMTVK